VLSQGKPRDAAVNFDTYRILQWHRAVYLLQHGFFGQKPSNADVAKWFWRTYLLTDSV